MITILENFGPAFQIMATLFMFFLNAVSTLVKSSSFLHLTIKHPDQVSVVSLIICGFIVGDCMLSFRAAMYELLVSLFKGTDGVMMIAPGSTVADCC